MGSAQHLPPRDRRERGVLLPVEGEEWRYKFPRGTRLVVLSHASGIGGAFRLVAAEGRESETFGVRPEDYKSDAALRRRSMERRAANWGWVYL